MVNNVPGTTRVTAFFVHSLKEDQPEVYAKCKEFWRNVTIRQLIELIGYSNSTAICPMDSVELDAGVSLGLPLS